MAGLRGGSAGCYSGSITGGLPNPISERRLPPVFEHPLPTRPRASRRTQGIVDGRTWRQVGQDRNERLLELGLLRAQGVLNLDVVCPVLRPHGGFVMQPPRPSAWHGG